MAEVKTFSSTQFVRSFASIKDRIHELGVVHVANHQRTVGGFLSPRELANYERLKRQEREILKLGELPDDVVTELKSALDAPY